MNGAGKRVKALENKLDGGPDKVRLIWVDPCLEGYRATFRKDGKERKIIRPTKEEVDEELKKLFPNIQAIQLKWIDTSEEPNQEQDSEEKNEKESNGRS